ncbi:MAG TPA: 3'-5' exonuclease, partial [Chthoniobacterales bacterium]|nr:3'-5' exonuclease [Chthoniobacterales bacterium]
LTKELDSLLALAAEAEAQGATLADFAEKLRADFDTPRDVRLSSDDGIQLITAQKAKGSEWQAVIVPFLARDIRSPVPRYPSLLKTPGSGEMLVALSKEDPSDELKKARTLSEQQEMQRLLYVATTRARHTLVLALDRELFLDVKGKLSSRAQLTLLHSDENSEQFEALSTTPEACALTSAAALELKSETDRPAPPRPIVDRKMMQKAGRRAADFVHKFNPSGYDEESSAIDPIENAPSIVIGRSTADTPATLYGNWWHSLFQQMPWQSGIEAADALFQQHLTSSPDKRRSAAEWKFVRESLVGDSILSRILSAKGAHAHTEFPFVWSVDHHACVEGVIDLLVMDEAAGKCLLVDWKTNRIAAGDEEKLRQRYRPQIAAYWKSVREITKLEVEGGIFATATGQFVAYDSGELETEWARLRSLPAEQLSSVAASLWDAPDRRN